MDATDRRILDALRRDAALTSAGLAAVVGLSPSAAHRRVKQLEERGLIRGYRAMLSREAQGNPTTAFVSVTLKDQTRETLSRFETALIASREVEEAHLMSGSADYLLKLSIQGGDSFERVHRDVLAQLPGVQRLVSHFSIRAVVEAG